MLLDVTQYTDPLSRMPALLIGVVDGRPDAWLDSRHTKDVLSPHETVAHLFLCEAEDSWITRIRKILEPGREFPAGEYDGIEDAEFAAARHLPEILTEFETWRKRNLQELEGLRLTTDDLERARTYSGFGDVTVGNILATWVAHDLYHLGQIYKSYSALYVGHVGPYQKYLNLPQFN